MAHKFGLYAIDIEPITVEYANKKTKTLGLSNVEVLLELENSVNFLREIERDKGPPPEEVYSEWELGLILEDAGFKVGRMVELSRYCFGAYAMVVKEGALHEKH